MPIVQSGSLNTTALVVPDLYVQVVPPQNITLNGVPSGRIGVVGTASWGPVNTPVICGSVADYVRVFGPVRLAKYDCGTQVWTAAQQGAQDFRVVRVTDGTDVAAGNFFNFTTISNFSAAINAKNTGTGGNRVQFGLSMGSSAGPSWKVTIGVPGQVPEVFDNIGGTGATFWTNLVNAVNFGFGALRGPSQLAVATIGTGAGLTLAPAAIPMVPLAGGTDGTTTITAAVLVGSDAAMPKTGMYSLRSQGCALLVVADADDSTQWTTIDGFAQSESLYAIQVGPKGDTISNAVTVKQTAGLDSYSSKLMFGDWLYWNDPTNSQQRIVSPQGFAAGRLANLSPEQSSLNKRLYSVVGSQKSGLPGSGAITQYSTADLIALFQAGLDVIANPAPGGAYWAVRDGHNSSSNAAVNGDNYTRMTNYIATTLQAGMGLYVGQLINATLFRRVRSTLLSFFANMLGQGLLGSTDGSLPYGVVCDISNNPLIRTSIGYLQADCQVQYQGIVEKFIVNLEGGATVTVSRQTLPAGQV